MLPCFAYFWRLLVYFDVHWEQTIYEVTFVIYPQKYLSTTSILPCQFVQCIRSTCLEKRESVKCRLNTDLTPLHCVVCAQCSAKKAERPLLLEDKKFVLDIIVPCMHQRYSMLTPYVAV